MVKYKFLKEGDTIGAFIFVEHTGSRNEKLIGKVKCFCGNVVEIPLWRAARLQINCGCVNKRKLTGENHPNYTHGATETSEYKIWHGMKERCKEKSKDRENYFDKGISVCARWQDSFENFLADMGTRPSPNHSIEREENKGIYEPSNCKWATPKEQAHNRSNNVYLIIGGRKMLIADWSRETGINSNTIGRRVK